MIEKIEYLKCWFSFILLFNGRFSIFKPVDILNRNQMILKLQLNKFRVQIIAEKSITDTWELEWVI